MKTSETVGEIAGALALAQLEMHNPTKDRTANVESDKAKYSYNYADLASVLDTVRPCLAKHGIALIQTPEVGAAFVVQLGEKTWRSAPLMLTTRLIHKSGEWIESQLASDIDPDGRIQTLGSAISYLRRYALQALVGVMAEEDDDGNGAQGTQAQTRQRRPRPANNGSEAPPPPPGPAGAKQRTPDERYDDACEEIIRRLGSDAGHKLIMALRAKYGGERPTEGQKVLLLRDVERTVAGEAVLPAAAGAST